MQDIVFGIGDIFYVPKKYADVKFWKESISYFESDFIVSDKKISFFPEKIIVQST